mgnify:CR=1 FL=1
MVLYEQLLNDAGFQVKHRYDVEPKEARFIDVPDNIDNKIKNYIYGKYGSSLFLHQAEAVRVAGEGQNVVLATSTASGKTLSFAVPVLQRLLENPNYQAIFLYPTKALANDQLLVLQDMAGKMGLGDCVYRFDGDTPFKQWDSILRRGRILISTPDVLHARILKRNKEKLYDKLLAHLAIVVIDESHIYSGAFGSNMAWVMRRLRQVCLRKGNRPQFIAASATSKNSGKHLESLTGVPFHVIPESMNGSPHSGRLFLMVDAADGENEEASHALVAGLIQSGKRFIAFCPSRKTAEKFYSTFTEEYPEFHQIAASQYFMPYRSGYEPEDRQKIETGIKQGTLLGVISTSALELGVDLPGLEYCLLLGLPSTAMSFWQRAGRVGRQKDVMGKIIIIPSSKGNPVDDYYRRHPEQFYQRPLEELVLHQDNRSILLAHFACARMESPDFNKPDLDAGIFGQQLAELAQNVDEIDLPGDDILRSLDPHSECNIRHIDDATYDILVGGGHRLGTITFSQLLREAYPHAVYRHMGNPYRVKRVKFHEHLVEVGSEQQRNTETSPQGYVHVRERAGAPLLRSSKWPLKLEILHVPIAVITSVTGYRERRGAAWHTTPYPQPLQRRVYSEGIMFKFLPSFGEYSYHGYNAFAHALYVTYTLAHPCESADIATYTVIRKDKTANIYIFDTTAGGLGLSTGIFDCFLDLLPNIRGLLTACEQCDQDSGDRGCPGCIQVPRWYEDNEKLSKREALRILSQVEELTDAEASEEYQSDLYKQRISGGFISITETIDEDRDEINAKYGIMLYNPGCVIQTKQGLAGEVMEQLPGEPGFYRVAFENGKTIRIRDVGFQLISGNVSYLCQNCGSIMDKREKLCEICNCDLF